MAELLIRNVDKINPNSVELNRMCMKRGDVVVVQEDGWPWSPAELSGNPWTIIKFPNTTVEDADPYLIPIMENDRIVENRASYFDLDLALPQQVFLGGTSQLLSYRVVK